ncbi:hypothetical protein F4055_14505 [Candidatus Poribacteria bacterium]|nr:hypothetical protein [Candidatus Poribacteria bacterium]
MLVSAVLDPSAFEADCFDDLYTIHTEDLLKGIQKNGLLIVDSGRRLQDALRDQVTSPALPIAYRKRLQSLVEELLKNRKRRIVECAAAPNSTSSDSLLEIASDLKTETGTDGLIVGSENFEKLRFDPEHRHGVVPLSEYRDSDFERERQRYCDGFGPIDMLPRSEVDEIVIRSIRFTKWLRFYDKQIGTGNNTSNFRRGIAYILSLWKEHGFFASQQGIGGNVEIFTCRDEHIPDDDIDDVNRKINRELMGQLRERFPSWWQVKLSVKEDTNGIFHARYLETQHAIIRIDRGFDLFDQNNKFRRNFFTLNMAEGSHLRECRQLPDANL